MRDIQTLLQTIENQCTEIHKNELELWYLQPKRLLMALL